MRQPNVHRCIRSTTLAVLSVVPLVVSQFDSSISLASVSRWHLIPSSMPAAYAQIGQPCRPSPP